MVAQFDVVIVGASIAGSTAAILLGRAGLRVALVERHGSLDAFKALCTHHVMACATPTIHRLGLDTTIEAAGGVRNGLNLYTPWGWVVTPPDTPARLQHPSRDARPDAAANSGRDARCRPATRAEGGCPAVAAGRCPGTRRPRGRARHPRAFGRRGGRRSLIGRRHGRRHDAGRTQQPVHVLRGVHGGAAPQHGTDRTVDARARHLLRDAQRRRRHRTRDDADQGRTPVVPLKSPGRVAGGAAEAARRATLRSGRPGVEDSSAPPTAR